MTRVGQRWVFEMDELVVEHADMSEDDFFELYRFKLWGILAYGAAYLKEIVMHGLTSDISPLEVYDELNAHPERYPFHHRLVSEYIENIKPLFFGSPHELEQKLSSHIEKYGNVDLFYWNRHLQLTMAKVLGLQSKAVFIGEVVEACKCVYRNKTGHVVNAGLNGDFEKILDELAQIQPECIISPLEKNDRMVQRTFEYDLKAWADENYEFPLTQYRLASPRTFALVIRNIQEHDNFYRDTRSFATDAEKYEYYYGVMVSSNMRRVIMYAEQDQSDVVHPRGG